jgi:hypothetical protein
VPPKKFCVVVDEVEEVIPQGQELLQDFHDTTHLPFPRRNRKAKMDE